MVRLTVDVISNCFERINPVKERELDIRGLKIPAIENVGATKDLYDTLDFSDNEIKKLDNFPRFSRLSCLLLNNNHIVRISPAVGDQIVNLETLILSNNRIANLGEIDNLSTCKKLTTLSLLGNPVIRRQHYRLYVIHKLPTLKILDFSKVKAAERKDAERLFASAAGKLMEQDVSAEKTFEPGEDLDEPKQQASMSLTDAQKAQVKAAIAAAKTPEEVDRIERQLKAGILPKVANQLPPPPPPPPPAHQPASDPTPPPQPTPMEEERSAEPAKAAADESAMEMEAENSDTLTEAMVMNMKVAELKDELKKRNEPTQGLKKALQDRLIELIK